MTIFDYVKFGQIIEKSHLILVSDEVNFRSLLSGSSWPSDFDVRVSFSLLKEDVNQVLLFILFWKDNFGLLLG